MKLATCYLSVLGFTLLLACVGLTTQPVSSQGPSSKGLTITPATVTLPTSGTQQFTATPAAGVTWVTDCGTIDANGLYTAPGDVMAFPITVTATSANGAASATVSLVAGITLTPTSATMVPGTTVQFTTTPADGVTWTAQRGTITATGLYTAPAPSWQFENPYINITAKSAHGNATAWVGVTEGAVAGGSNITPFSVVLKAGATQQFTFHGPSIPNAHPVNQADIPWMATGGTVTAGLYTAGATPGIYTVAAGSDHVVTARVTIIAASTGTVMTPPGPTQPDLLVRRGDWTFQFKGAYGNAELQTRLMYTSKGKPVTFMIRLENDGKDGGIMVTGPAGNADWTVTYATADGKDITAAVTTTGWSTTLAANAQQDLTLTVTPQVEGNGNRLFKAVIWAKDAINDTLADCLTCVTVYLPSPSLPAPITPLAGTTIVQPLASYTGSVADVTKMKNAVSPITDQVTLSALWADWKIKDLVPTVDFNKQFVVVSTYEGSMMQGGLFQSLTLDDKGNMTVDVFYAIQQLNGVQVRSFNYVIFVIDHAGITSVNGVPLPVPVPILNTISADDSLQQTADTVVIKDVAAWKELYDKKMPAGTPLPEVDFGKDMALIVFVGQQNTPYRTTVAVSQVLEADGKIQVKYNALLWTFSQENPPASPWVAVIVPKSDLPVTFTAGKPLHGTTLTPTFG